MFEIKELENIIERSIEKVLNEKLMEALSLVYNVYFLQQLKINTIQESIQFFDEFHSIPYWKEFAYKVWYKMVEKYKIKFEYISATYNNQIAVKVINL